jgi:hypothetical protein
MKNVRYTFSGGPYATQSMLVTINVPTYTSRLNPAYGQMVATVSNVNSSYHAMVVQLNRRMTHGLQLQLNYTWARALDNGQNSSTQAPTSSQVYDPNNPKLEYGTSNYDIRHRFTASVVWHPPYFRNSGRWTRALLDGWSVAPLIQISSGRPYSDYISGSVSSYASGVGISGTTGYLDGGLNNAGGNRLATLLGRNSFRYPALANVDLRLSRQFRLSERHRVEVLAEAFNLFNREQITGLNDQMYTLGYGSGGRNTSGTAANPLLLTYQPTFGSYNQAGTNLYRERQIQLGARYSF